MQTICTGTVRFHDCSVTGQPLRAQLPTAGDPLDATGHPINPDELTRHEIAQAIADAHAHCTECSACGAGWDAKLRREAGTIRPGTLVGLAFALVPITLLLTFSARLAGMLAGTVGGVA